MKIIFFDCDKTLWSNSEKDYISSVSSVFKKINKNTIIREKDKKIFSLNITVLQMLEYINKRKNVLMGIVSDNKKTIILQVLKLFGIDKYFSKDLLVIKLYKGYCPKHEMIRNIYLNSKFKNISPKNIYWIDDKNYAKEAKEIGVNFIKISYNTDFIMLIKSLNL